MQISLSTDKIMSSQVVVLVFNRGKKIFTEKRLFQQFNNYQYLIPGGKVKKKEFADIETAVKREAMEELGVKLIDFAPLTLNQNIYGIYGQILRPFIIKKWTGKLPKVILDKGNPTAWVDIDILSSCTFEPTRKVVEAFKKYLPSKK